MSNLISQYEFLTDADLEVATALGITFTGSIEDELNKIVQAQNSIAGLTLASGYMLLKVKTEVEHGEFDDKLKAFGIPRQRASELMRISKFYTSLPEEKRQQVYRLGKSKRQMGEMADMAVVQDILDDPEAGIGELSVREMRRKILELEGKLANANAKIEADDSRIRRLESKQFITQFEHETEAVREECLQLQATCEIGLNGLLMQFNEATNSLETPEKQLRIEHAYIATVVATSRALELVEHMRKAGYTLPERIKGEHILTPEESARWVHDYPMLESAHSAKQVKREVDRENAKEGKRGRKLGSTNKAKE
jgi:hypothetical protein